MLKHRREMDQISFQAKERLSLLLMLRALLNTSRNNEIIPSSVKKIKDSLNLLGANMDEDTIRKFIDQSDAALKRYLSEHSHD